MVQIPEQWKDFLPSSWWNTHDGLRLQDFLNTTPNNKQYPERTDIFRALTLTPPSKVQVVILGQDPYHGFGQAHGLAFSVRQGTPAPPSLRNIFKELKNDLNIERTNTDLSDWAKQGVLLLNTALTVEDGKPGSHMALWEPFTDNVIKTLSQTKKQTVFVLWGAFAQKKAPLLAGRSLIQSAHPSPLSAYRGFFDSHPFSKINDKIERPIFWGHQKPRQS